MTPRALTRIDPEQNMRRFYRLSIQPGLFGDVSLVREWGRIGAAGQSKTDWFEDEIAAEVASDKIARQKLKRGYE